MATVGFKPSGMNSDNPTTIGHQYSLNPNSNLLGDNQMDSRSYYVNNAGQEILPSVTQRYEFEDSSLNDDLYDIIAEEGKANQLNGTFNSILRSDRIKLSYLEQHSGPAEIQKGRGSIFGGSIQIRQQSIESEDGNNLLELTRQGSHKNRRKSREKTTLKNKVNEIITSRRNHSWILDNIKNSHSTFRDVQDKLLELISKAQKYKSFINYYKTLDIKPSTFLKNLNIRLSSRLLTPFESMISRVKDSGFSDLRKYKSSTIKGGSSNSSILRKESSLNSEEITRKKAINTIKKQMLVMTSQGGSVNSMGIGIGVANLTAADYEKIAIKKHKSMVPHQSDCILFVWVLFFIMLTCITRNAISSQVTSNYNQIGYLRNKASESSSYLFKEIARKRISLEGILAGPYELVDLAYFTKKQEYFNNFSNMAQTNTVENHVVRDYNNNIIGELLKFLVDTPYYYFIFRQSFLQNRDYSSTTEADMLVNLMIGSRDLSRQVHEQYQFRSDNMTESRRLFLLQFGGSLLLTLSIVVLYISRGRRLIRTLARRAQVYRGFESNDMERMQNVYYELANQDSDLQQAMKTGKTMGKIRSAKSHLEGQKSIKLFKNLLTTRRSNNGSKNNPFNSNIKSKSRRTYKSSKKSNFKKKHVQLSYNKKRDQRILVVMLVASILINLISIGDYLIFPYFLNPITTILELEVNMLKLTSSVYLNYGTTYSRVNLASNSSLYSASTVAAINFYHNESKIEDVELSTLQNAFTEVLDDSSLKDQQLCQSGNILEEIQNFCQGQSKEGDLTILVAFTKVQEYLGELNIHVDRGDSKQYISNGEKEFEIVDKLGSIILEYLGTVTKKIEDLVSIKMIQLNANNIILMLAYLLLIIVIFLVLEWSWVGRMKEKILYLELIILILPQYLLIKNPLSRNMLSKKMIL